MYNSSGLIPAKFLILISHFAVCVSLLWNTTESVQSCLPEAVTEYTIYNHRTQLVAGLSVAVALICFELLAFLMGLTMFNSTSALLYMKLFLVIMWHAIWIARQYTPANFFTKYDNRAIATHAGACILLVYLIVDSWQCGWFWWIISFGSVLPFLNDLIIVLHVLINRKY